MSNLASILRRALHNARACTVIIGAVPFSASLLATPSSAQAIVYDLVANYSATANPNGVWLYGESTTLGGTFTPYANPIPASGGLDTWTNKATAHSPALLGKNSTASTIVFSSVSVAANQAYFHPGINNEISIFRFTAPTAGSYTLTSSFEGIDFVGQTTSEVFVLHNSSSIFSAPITGFGSPSARSFNSTLALATGDTVDFAVGYGSNGHYLSDSTGITASLSVVPEPTSLATFGIASALFRRRR